MGNGNFGGIDRDPVANADQHVFRGGWGFELSQGKVSDRGRGFTGGPIFRDCLHCRSLRTAFPAGAAASASALGMVAILSRAHRCAYRGRDRAQPASGDRVRGVGGARLRLEERLLVILSRGIWRRRDRCSLPAPAKLHRSLRLRSGQALHGNAQDDKTVATLPSLLLNVQPSGRSHPLHVFVVIDAHLQAASGADDREHRR